MTKGFRPGHGPGEKLTKEEKAKQKDFQERQEKMFKEVKALGVKYRIDIVGTLDYRPTGIVPLLAFKDVKDEYEQKAKEDPGNKSLIV